MSFVSTIKASANTEISLKTLEATDDYYLYQDGFDKNFTDVNGNVVDNALGLRHYDGGAAYARYNIKDMEFKTFSTQITLDSNYLLGDYGKSAVGIYADDTLLYEKQLSKTDGILTINVSIPKDTNELTLKVAQLEGAKGTQGVVFINPSLSSDGKEVTTPPTSFLDTIGSSDKEYYYSQPGRGNGEVSRDIKGNLTTQSIMLNDYDGGVAYATYNIDQMGYNVFETKLSLDSSRLQGDYGYTAVGIYADDILLYEKQLTTKTPVQNIKLNIPKGTKNLKFVAQQIKGARGTANVVFNNPVVKKTKDALISVPKTVSVNTVGAIEYSCAYNLSGNEIQYVNSELPTSGIYFDGTYNDQYATYDITNMGFNAFKGKLSLDSKYINGDYGKSNIYMYANGKLFYSRALSKSSGIINLNLRLPRNTKTVKIVAKQQKGAKGYQRIVIGNAIFAQLPVSSTLKTSQITVKNNKKKNDTVTVRSLTKGDVIKVYSSRGSLLATSQASGTSLSISIKQLGTKKGTVLVSKTSSGKLESDKVSIGYKAE